MPLALPRPLAGRAGDELVDPDLLGRPGGDLLQRERQADLPVAPAAVARALPPRLPAEEVEAAELAHEGAQRVADIETEHRPAPR